MKNLRIFGLDESWLFANRIAEYLARDMGSSPMPRFELSRHDEQLLPDGEWYVRSLENVRGCDVYVITSLFSEDGSFSVNDRLVKLFVFINMLRHAGASRITVVARYLCYMRQDRKVRSRDPISTQAVAICLESLGMDRLITMDMHNVGAEQNAFRVPIDNLEARKLLADAVTQEIKSSGIDCVYPWKVVAPDAGGTGRAKLFQHSLAKRLGIPVDVVYADKTRVDASTVKMTIVGNIKDCWCVVIDDMISTGTTIAEIQKAIAEQGGRMYAVCVTHGLFADKAFAKLSDIPLIFATDTVNWNTHRRAGLHLVSTVEMFAEAIRRTHEEGGSISELLDDDHFVVASPPREAGRED